MRKSQLIGLFMLALMLAGAWFFSQKPKSPARHVVVEIVNLEDVPEGKGRRLITVRFENGEERTIETLAPFFFKPGYKAVVGVYKRVFFSDIYDIVSDSVD